MDERDNRGELFVSGRKRWHSLIQPTIAHHLCDFVAVYVLRD
jgi:hypothetical protein